jgi:PAS domain S-box-containing protein
LNKRAIDIYGTNYIGYNHNEHIAKVKALKLDETPFTLDEMPVTHALKYGKQVRNEKMIIEKASGKKIPVLVSSSPLFDERGNLVSSISVFEDITELKKTEDSLRESEEKYRYLYNSIDEGFAIVDVIFDSDNKPVDFKFVELNPAYEKQTGIIIKDILGKTAKELGFDFEDSWYEIYGRVALTGESTRFVNEVKTLSKWLEAFAFKIDLNKNNRVGIIFNDITEKETHSRKLEELLKMQDELYLNVSHELKTPLNVIFSANQMIDIYLKDNKIEDKKDKLISYNNHIKQNCYRITRLINNIVDLSKSNSRLLTLNLNNVNIVDVVKNIVDSVSDFIESKKLKIIFCTNVEEKIIACDIDKIERIMLNLISNAIKFSNQNGNIYVNVLNEGEKVEISVKDSGIGIERQNLDCIFNRFFQEDKSLSRNAEGTGIGLSLIKSLVELHEGTISVESEINKGSVFKVVLPVKTIERNEIVKQNNSFDNKIESIKIEFSDIYSV